MGLPRDSPYRLRHQTQSELNSVGFLIVQETKMRIPQGLKCKRARMDENERREMDLYRLNGEERKREIKLGESSWHRRAYAEPWDFYSDC
jgi:hypothetical protein